MDAATDASLMQYILNFDDNFSPPTYAPVTPTVRRNLGQPDFRRHVYEQGFWAQRLTDITGRTEDSCPEFYR